MKGAEKTFEAQNEKQDMLHPRGLHRQGKTRTIRLQVFLSAAVHMLATWEILIYHVECQTAITIEVAGLP